MCRDGSPRPYRPVRATCPRTHRAARIAGRFPSLTRRSLSGRLCFASEGPDEARLPPEPTMPVVLRFALFPWKTVRENIAFGLKCKNVSRRERDAVVHRYLDLMGMAGTEENYPHQLSGGMQQRVAIARSYAIDPDVLLMDEPFGSLDAQTRILMQEELIRISRINPRTVLFITHAVEEAVYLADRVVVLARSPGRIVEI